MTQVRTSDNSDYNRQKMAFAPWLLAQMKRDDAIGLLARACHSDRQFPVNGDANTISKRLNQLGADPEMHFALEEAELDWLTLLEPARVGREEQ